MFEPCPYDKVPVEWLEDSPGEIRCMFDKEGNYLGDPALKHIKEYMIFLVGLCLFFGIPILCGY